MQPNNINILKINKNKYRFVCGLVMHLFPRFAERAWVDTETLVNGETPVIQILVSKYHSLVKGTRVPRSRDWFEVWSRENTKWAWNISWCQKMRKCFRKDGDSLKGHRSQLEGAPNCPSKNFLRDKVNNVVLNYSPLHKLNIHELIGIYSNNWISKWGSGDCSYFQKNSK